MAPKKRATREVAEGAEVGTQAFDPTEFLVDPTLFDPRKAEFGTPIAFPDPNKDYPTTGTIYPPPV